MKNHEPSSPDQQHKPVQEESFLRRWSKRKQEVSATTEEKAGDNRPVQVSADQKSETDVCYSDPSQDQSRLQLTDEDMPTVETLDENSDFSGFLSPKVSETLRRQALRKLFHFQQFNITDGLDDYAEDFTHFEKLGDVITHEMKRILQREADKLQGTANNNQIYQDAAVTQQKNATGHSIDRSTVNTDLNASANEKPNEVANITEIDTNLEQALNEVVVTDVRVTKT